MWQIFKRYPKAYLWSVLLHLSLLVLLLTSVDWLVRSQKVGGFESMIQARMTATPEIERRIEALRAAAPPSEAEAAQTPAPDPGPVVDDTARLEQEREAALAREAELERQRQAELERQRQAELERQRQAELERQRQAELERQRQAELERQRQAEDEARRRAEDEIRRQIAEEAERRAAEEAERRAQQAERRRLALEAERKAREEEEARRRAEQEERRRVEEQRLAEEEAQRREAQERARREAERRERELQAALEAENDRASVSAGARAQIASRWVPAIQSRVRQFWVRPTIARTDLETIVNLRLQAGGDVVPDSVRVIRGSGNAAFDQSVVLAIYKASPLPVPDGREFDMFKDFNFVFRP
jgi:colicin import membrane protein